MKPGDVDENDICWCWSSGTTNQVRIKQLIVNGGMDPTDQSQPAEY